MTKLITLWRAWLAALPIAHGRFVGLTAALILVIPAALPLIAPGYFFDAHDAHHSVFYLVEYDQGIRDGVLWPVWNPDHAIGFGYPLWLIYAPLAYAAAELFHLLGLGFTAAVKATWALGFLLGAWGVYRLARRWWGPAAALAAAAAFAYAPYRLVQIYVRGDLAEFIALSLAPWVLLAFVRLWDQPGPRPAALAALALAALTMTHTAAPLLFGPLLGGLLLAQMAASVWRERRVPIRSVLWSGAALTLGLLITAIFLLPAFLERKYLVESQWIAATYNYRQHFVYLNQFFSASWGFGYALPGPNDGMSFQLGPLQFLGGALGALAVIQSRRSRLPHLAQTGFLLLASLIAIVAMTPVAAPAWDVLPLVKLLQYPWRLLAVTAVTLPLLTGAGVSWLEREAQAWGQPAASHAASDAAPPNPFVAVFALALALVSFPYTRPQLVPIRPQDESPAAVLEFEQKHPDMRGMTAYSERMPQDADSPLIAQYLAAEPLQRAAIATGAGRIISQGATANTATARVEAQGDVRLRFYTYYFPGWQATVDGRPVELAPEPPNGLITLDVPPGEHLVQLRFGPTPLRRLAAAITLTSLAIAGLLFFGERLFQRRRRA